MSKVTLEQWKAWWHRVTYETPPFAWKSDPKLAGMTQEQFDYLRECPAEPADVPTYLRCAALDWDKSVRDYVACSPVSTVRMVRVTGLITAELGLCDNHRRYFEEEMEKFGGHLDQTKRVTVL
jgi:hypothetical protein